MGEIERILRSSQWEVIVYEWNQYYCHDWIHVYMYISLDKGLNATVSDEPTAWSSQGQQQCNARDNVDDSTPIQHLSIMNYICARKCESSPC